jgi:hypothetical protein
MSVDIGCRVAPRFFHHFALFIVCFMSLQLFRLVSPTPDPLWCDTASSSVVLGLLNLAC